MLELVHINEYVYLRDVDLYFSEGLNVITGETGTGKTLILDVLGAFLDYGSLRSETFSADVVLDLSNSLVNMEELRDYRLGEGTHVFSVEKRGRRMFYKIDGRPVSKDVVTAIFENVISIHKQNSHIKLLEKRYVLDVIDQVAESGALLQAYRSKYGEYVNVLKLLSKTTVSELERVVSELSEKINEIENARLSVEEETELERRYKELSNLQNLVQNYNQVLAQLDDIEYTFRRFYQLLDEEMHGYLDNVIENVAGLGNQLRRALARIDEVNLEEIEQRLWVYRKLRRKYGPTTEDVLEQLKNAKNEFEQKTRELELLRNAESEKRRLEAELLELGLELRQMRQSAARKMERDIERHLSELNMNARIKFDFREIPLGPNGLDEVELVGSTLGIGELMPLRKIASGGELSRIMLALELSVAATPVLVYDEIDTGVGGTTAVKLAQKLKALSKRKQIIVITHLPQIALLADKHFAVYREGDVGSVLELDESGRREELKRMVGGEQFFEQLLESVGVEDEE